MYAIKQEHFEGPLDLLLELITKEKLSINEISLAKVTDEFIAHLGTLQAAGKARLPDGQADRELIAEFLVIAATLLLVKSRSLLPQFQPTAEEEESIAELERRLTEYQRLKAVSQELGRLARGGPHAFSREAYTGTQPAFHPPTHFEPAGLKDAFRAVLAALPKVEELAEKKLKHVISLEEKIQELHALLREKVERVFSELVAGAKEKVEVIVSFLALLELAKQKLVTVKQEGLFEDIKIRKAL